jgi:hypothetical protein
MRDEPLNRQRSTVTDIDQLTRLDQRLIHALERAPEPQVPVDFAARVARLLPATRPVAVTATHYGYYAMVVSMVLLLAALLLLAPHAADRSVFGLTLQWLLCAQFIGLVVWLSSRRRAGLST